MSATTPANGDAPSAPKPAEPAHHPTVAPVETNGAVPTSAAAPVDPASDAAGLATSPISTTTGPAPQTGPSAPSSSSDSKNYKRIIVCCDGTWQDGIERKYRWQYTNVLKMARIFEREDRRVFPPIQQVVFYQSGVGTEDTLYSKYMGGGFGVGLAEKVQEAYAFIATNYDKGDEIFLFGFSRGAYTARMTAEFIGAIGILDKKDMDHFAEIFVAYQTMGQTSFSSVKKEQLKILSRFTSVTSKGKLFVESKNGFAIKCVGVFDTVGSLGLPEGLVGKKENRLFGFNDRILGTHVEYALQALALNETRVDFSPAQFIQSEEGKKKGQILKQCWFTGSHSDVGGGYEEHDLSDVTLMWMLANLQDVLAIDFDYLTSSTHPKMPYGELPPHDSHTGVFLLAASGTRPLPVPPSKETCEKIHPSVKGQKSLRKDVAKLLTDNPDMYWDLLPLEASFRDGWPYKGPEANGTATVAATTSAAGASGLSRSDTATSKKDKRGSVILDTVKNIYATLTKKDAGKAVKETVPGVK